MLSDTTVCIILQFASHWIMTLYFHGFMCNMVDVTAPSSGKYVYCNHLETHLGKWWLSLGIIWSHNVPSPFCRHPDLGLHGAVWSPQRAYPRAGSLLRVLAQRSSGCDPDTDSRHHGWVDHEHLLGNGHGHPGESVLVYSVEDTFNIFASSHIYTGDKLQTQRTSVVTLKSHALTGIVLNKNK